MPYTANNAALYNAAYNGYVAGVNLGRTIGGLIEDVTSQGAMFAELVDAAIPFDAQLDSSKVELLSNIVTARLAGIFPFVTDGFQALVSQTISLYNEAVSSLQPVPQSIGGAIVFKPGVPSIGYTYATAQEIAEQVGLNGAVIVIIDNSLAPAIIPEGVFWDFNGYGGLGGSLADVTNNILEIQDGAQVRRLGSITNVLVQCDSASMPALDWGVDWPDEPTLTIDGGGIFMSPASSMPAIQIPSGGALVIKTIGGGSLQTGGSSAMISIAAGGVLFLEIFGLFFPFPVDLFSGGAGSQYYYAGDSTAFPIPAWSLFTGSIGATPQFFDFASGVGYTPAVPGNWAGSAPTTVQQALDRIAANVGNTHPIP